MKCAYCGSDPDQLTVWRHASGVLLQLCFHGCQHFPEPFNATGLSDEWERIDPWVKKRPQPHLRHAREAKLSTQLPMMEKP